MSLLMDIQTNRCWARVDFLATGEIVLHIPEECELPIRVLVSRGGRSTEYEPKSSEKPNNCEDLQDWKDRMWAEAIVTEPTISKMEQVDEPQTYVINPQEPTNDDKCFECDDFFICGGQCNKIEDEPQTDCAWK